jgi:hypothetical protein
MKLPLQSLIVSALLAGGNVHAADLHLLPQTATDQVPTRLQALTIAKSATATLDRTPSAMSWAIDPQATLDTHPTPFVRESREYWIDATDVELQRGVNLSTSAAGALVRLSPHAGNSAMLDASTLSFRANGKLYASTDAVHAAADQDALRTAGMDVPQGTLVVKLADALGTGKIELIAPGARGSYLIHVFEPSSPIVLTLQAGRDTIIAGEPIQFRASIQGGGSLDRLSGLVSAPDGHNQAIDFTRQTDGSFAASVTPDAAHAGGHGLWEVHAFGNATSKKLSVQRDARSAFAVSIAAARLDGVIENVTTRAKDAGVTMRVGVETADASRYQLSGVLYGTLADGSLRPAAIAHSAAWLDAGRRTIDLRFDADALAQSGVAAPYELRDLRLINQADMSLIERRERAVAVR